MVVKGVGSFEDERDDDGLDIMINSLHVKWLKECEEWETLGTDIV